MSEKTHNYPDQDALKEYRDAVDALQQAAERLVSDCA